MLLTENFQEALRAIKGNLLRTTLTALIITIGITALVGILTAIDGIQASVNANLADLGANSFDIKRKGMSGRRSRMGVSERRYPEITYTEARRYKQRFDFQARISISTSVSFNAEAKRGSRKTNPNSSVVGGDEGYLLAKGYTLAAGREFSANELRYGTGVAIIGSEIAKALFINEDPLNKVISVLGSKYLVIGVLGKTGSVVGGSGADRIIHIPIERARTAATDRALTYEITTIVANPAQLENAMATATGIMRNVRGDKPGKSESFEVSRSESLATTLGSITQSLRVAGFGIGFITLLGAAIGLMNIMLVSVTERTREIGVRKALGATPSIIRQQFLVEAVVICLMGGMAGTMLGILVGNAVTAFIGSASFIIPWLWIGLGLMVCIVVGILSGYYPALKASKLDPIESLRFE